MNNNLEMMLNNTKVAMEKAKEYSENQIKKELQEQEERKTPNYDQTCQEAIMINSLGLNIDLFEPSKDDGYDSDAAEFYYCSNERWNVMIRNLLYDPDLGSILQVLDLTDKKTGEKTHFYCDLWCKNTPKQRLEKLKILLNSSAQEYIDQEFGIYYSLPTLLREKGFTVEENNYTFNTDKCNGSLKIKNESISQTYCELIISHYYYISTFLQNFTNRLSFLDKLHYRFSYNGEEDIDNLSNMINAFIEHIDGKFGYFENNTYYSNKNLEKIFNFYKNKFTNVYDITSHWDFEFRDDENINPELMDKYLAKKDIVEINHFKGAEIYKVYNLHLNYEAIHRGGVDIKYIFEIIYNRNIDNENCILNITSITAEYIPWTEELMGKSNIVDKTENSLTLKGRYTFIENTIKTLLDNLLSMKK